MAYSVTTAQLALQLSALAYVDENTNASQSVSKILLSLNDGAANLKSFITARAQHAQILVTGHSLGGCLAAALAPCIATWVGAANISVYTYAAPPWKQ